MEPHLQRQLILTLDIMGPITAGRFAKVTGMRFPYAQSQLREMVRRGQVQKTTQGEYVLTDSGRKMAAVWLATCGQ